MLVDQRGLQPGDLCSGGESIECQVLEVVGISDRDMYDEVLLSCHVVDRDDLGQAYDVVAECIHHVPGVLRQSDGDEGLHSDADRAWIDLGVKSGDDAALLQSPDSLEAGRGCQTDGSSELFVGHSAIIL